MPLYQRCNLAVGIAEQEIAFPMTRHCTILYAGWALANGHCIDDSAMDRRLLGVMA